MCVCGYVKVEGWVFGDIYELPVLRDADSS